MKVRGERECTECGTRWSYYETGEVACPSCGGLRSVGVDERTRHTDAPVTYDLDPVRAAVDEAPLEEVADRAAEASAEYVRRRGFLHAGDLEPLDDVFLAAATLRHVAGALSRELRRTEDEELFFLDLLAGADEGDRPAPEDVPETFQGAVGLAAADAVAAFQRDLRTYLEDHPDEDARGLSGRIRDHRKRIEALDGDVSPRDAERLVRATRDVGKYCRTGDESALVTAENWLEGLAGDE